MISKLDCKESVRLLLLNPITPGNGAEGPFPLEPQEYLLTTTQVDQIYCSDGPRSITDGNWESVVPLVVSKTEWAESQGYDAVVVNCMLDPGVPEAKRAVDIPVVGLREATLAVASLIGKRPASIYPANIPVLKLPINEEKTFLKTLESGKHQIANRGADVLIPNCSRLQGLAQRLQAELGVPVLPNKAIGLKLAELLATFKVRPKQEWVQAMMAHRLYRFFYHSGSLLYRAIIRWLR